MVCWHHGEWNFTIVMGETLVKYLFAALPMVNCHIWHHWFAGIVMGETLPSWWAKLYHRDGRNSIIVMSKTLPSWWAKLYHCDGRNSAMVPSPPHPCLCHPHSSPHSSFPPSRLPSSPIPPIVKIWWSGFSFLRNIWRQAFLDSLLHAVANQKDEVLAP